VTLDQRSSARDCLESLISYGLCAFDMHVRLRKTLGCRGPVSPNLYSCRSQAMEYMLRRMIWLNRTLKLRLMSDLFDQLNRYWQTRPAGKYMSVKLSRYTLLKTPHDLDSCFKVCTLLPFSTIAESRS